MVKDDNVLRVTKSGRLRDAEGRFAAIRKSAAAPSGAELQKLREPLQPSQCSAYLRRELANSFSSIVQGFVKQAESGSVQHLKLTTELLEKLAAPKKQKGSAQRMLEKLGRMERDRRKEEEALPPDSGWQE